MFRSENKEVSSPKVFVVNHWYRSEKEGPDTEPWRIPAFTNFQSKDWTFGVCHEEMNQLDEDYYSLHYILIYKEDLYAKL